MSMSWKLRSPCMLMTPNSCSSMKQTNSMAKMTQKKPKLCICMRRVILECSRGRSTHCPNIWLYPRYRLSMPQDSCSSRKYRFSSTTNSEVWLSMLLLFQISLRIQLMNSDSCRQNSLEGWLCYWWVCSVMSLSLALRRAAALLGWLSYDPFLETASRQSMRVRLRRMESRWMSCLQKGQRRLFLRVRRQILHMPWRLGQTRSGLLEVRLQGEQQMGQQARVEEAEDLSSSDDASMSALKYNYGPIIKGLVCSLDGWSNSSYVFDYTFVGM